VETVSAKLLTTDLFRRQSEDPALGGLRRFASRCSRFSIAGRRRYASGKAAFSYAHPLFWAPFSVVGEAAGR
jgi:hypothetical protein